MSQLTLTVKVRLKCSDEDHEELLSSARAYVRAANFVSEYIMSSKILSLKMLNRDIYRRIRSEYSLRSQMAQSVMKYVIAKYRAYRTAEKRWPEKAIRFKKPVTELVYNRDYSFRPECISVNTLGGRRKISFYRSGTDLLAGEGVKYGTATLVERHGKWYMHIPVIFDVPEIPACSVNNVAGVDLGINFLAVCYNSSGRSVFHDGRKVKKKRAHYKELRRQLQKRQTPSARRRLKSIGQRENRWANDVNHCISKSLTARDNGENTLFVLEDLTGIRSSTERVRLKERYVSVSWPFADLRNKIEYKARKYNSKAIAVDPAYTSQTCPRCGRTDRNARDKKKHIYKCGCCGYTSNDDRIGAMNLYNKGIEYLETAVKEQAAV